MPNLKEIEKFDKVVIYHRGCTDGFAAAWLARKVWKDALFLAAMYGEDTGYFDLLRGKDILITDFSFPRADLERLHSISKSLLVLDHHQTAQKDLEGLPYCRFDNNKSGATLTLNWVKEQGCEVSNDIELLALYIEDRDLWKFALPDSEIISIAIRSYPQNFDVWDELFLDNKVPWEKLKQEGSAIQKYRKQMIEIHVNRASYLTIGGYDVPVVECSNNDIISEVATKLAEYHPFAACYYFVGDKVVFSLRSIPPDGIDVSEIAKLYGGGGHKHASGFAVPAAFRIWLQSIVNNDKSK